MAIGTSARRETTLQRGIAVKNVSLGIFDPSLGIFDPARCRRNPDFWGGFPPKPRSVLRNRQGIPRLSGVSSRAHEAGMRALNGLAPVTPFSYELTQRADRAGGVTLCDRSRDVSQSRKPPLG